MLFPLLLVTGVFEPQVLGFSPRGNFYERWLNTILQLSVPDNVRWPPPSTYCLDKLLTIEIQGGDRSQWYERAIFKIRQLTDIRDSGKVDDIVAELLGL